VRPVATRSAIGSRAGRCPTSRCTEAPLSARGDAPLASAPGAPTSAGVEASTSTSAADGLVDEGSKFLGGQIKDLAGRAAR
jgi:hypothetical protein